MYAQWRTIEDYEAMEEAIARGEMDDRSKTLSRVIGGPTTPLAAAIAAALSAPPPAPARS